MSWTAWTEALRSGSRTGGRVAAARVTCSGVRCQTGMWEIHGCFRGEFGSAHANWNERQQKMPQNRLPTAEARSGKGRSFDSVAALMKDLEAC